MSENRTPPFCCQQILPQTPFYKHENYPRAYTCILDFLQLATRFPNHLPQISLSKALQQHDFVIRLCKGQADPRFGPNQWSTARYFLHDPDIQGGLVEVIDSPNGDRSSSLETLKCLLHEREGTFGGFLFLEDVRMTVVCPVHNDATWFLQFWTKGPRDSGHLEEVSKRVRCRLNKEPGFVDDPFTVRFNEMMGIPTLAAQRERESRGRSSIGDFTYGVNPGDAFGKLRDEQKEVDSRQRFGAQRKDLFRFPPGLQPPPGFGPPPSNPSDPALNFPPGISTFNRGLDHPVSGGVLYPQHKMGPNFHPPTTMNDIYAQGRRYGFLGTALQWEDPALRAGFTPHLPNLAPPPGLPDYRHDISQLHSPQPSRSFDMANMWQSFQPQAAQPDFLPQHERVIDREPYGTYQQDPRLPPQQRIPQDEGWEDISHQIVSRKNQLPPSKLSSPGGPLRDSRPSHRSTGASLPGTGDISSTLPSFTQSQQPAEAARPRDTNVSDTSAHTPPTGNTSGLRPIERRAWDDGEKEWKSYWVWSS